MPRQICSSMWLFYLSSFIPVPYTCGYERWWTAIAKDKNTILEIGLARRPDLVARVTLLTLPA